MHSRKLVLLSFCVSLAALVVSGVALLNPRAEEVDSYIMQHPDLIGRAVDKLNRDIDDKNAKSDSILLAKYSKVLDELDGASSIGPSAAKIVIVEFMDYKCSVCRGADSALKNMLEKNSDVRLEVVNLPILSPISKTAARYADAAARQGKFREVHDTLLQSNFQTIGDIEAAVRSGGASVVDARAYAKSDLADLSEKRSRAVAVALKLSGTPAFIVGDRLLRGWSEPQLKQAIEEVRQQVHT